MRTAGVISTAVDVSTVAACGFLPAGRQQRSVFGVPSVVCVSSLIFVATQWQFWHGVGDRLMSVVELSQLFTNR